MGAPNAAPCDMDRTGQRKERHECGHRATSYNGAHGPFFLSYPIPVAVLTTYLANQGARGQGPSHSLLAYASARPPFAGVLPSRLGRDPAGAYSWLACRTDSPDG